MTHPRIVHEAKEFAGCFYEKKRSGLFRDMWPSQDEYVKHKWPHFVEAVREVWSAMLGRNDVPESHKQYIYEALIADAKESNSPNASTVIQIAPGTQQFEGDPFENRQTAKNIANGSSTHEYLMNSAMKHRH